MKLTPADRSKGQVRPIIYKAISIYLLAGTQGNCQNLHISHIPAGLFNWLLAPQSSGSRYYLHCFQFRSPCARLYTRRPGQL